MNWPLNRILPYLTALLVLTAAGCGPNSTAKDENMLQLYRTIPLGATPAQVIRAFPSAGPLLPEAGGSEIRGQASVIGLRADVEFNFQGDSLYGVSFNAPTLSAQRGDALFDRLVKFYSARFGKAEVSDGQDDPYYVRYRSWNAGNCEVGVVMSLDGGSRHLGWGYQEFTNMKRSR
jgi:hypothetical protein